MTSPIDTLEAVLIQHGAAWLAVDGAIAAAKEYVQEVKETTWGLVGLVTVSYRRGSDKVGIDEKALLAAAEKDPALAKAITPFLKSKKRTASAAVRINRAKLQSILGALGGTPDAETVFPLAEIHVPAENPTAEAPAVQMMLPPSVSASAYPATASVVVQMNNATLHDIVAALAALQKRLV